MKRTKNMGWYTLAILSAFLVFITITLACSNLGKVIEPEGTIFWVTGKFYNLIFVVEILCLIIVPTFILRYRRVKKEDASIFEFGIGEKIIDWMKKHLILSVLILFAIMYLIVTDSTYITADKIYHKSWSNPIGKVYEYKDVVGVETGFRGAEGFSRRNRGEFYYYIILIDGQRVNLNSTGGVNEDQVSEYDTYREIEVFDETIMKNNISKISSLENSEYCNFDPVYKNRLEAIIENK